MRQDNSREVSSLVERYYSILEKLEKDVPFLIKSVYNLGRPSFLGICSTACVGMDKINEDLFYDWDADFFKNLKDEEVGFVVLHETLHILLDHIGKTSQSLEREKWNIACDVVINDYLNYCLIHGYKMKNIKPPSKIVTGLNTLGSLHYSLQDYSAENIYLKLKDKNKEASNYNCIDDHSSWDDIPAEIAKKIRDVLSKDPEIKKAVGRGLLPGSCIEVAEKRKNEFSLKKIIKHIVATKTEENYRENWRRYNVKLSTIYPEVILPYITANENRGKLSLLFAIDVSGSMSSKLIAEMIAIAKNHEIDNDVTAIQFDTKVYPLDLKERKLIGRGGTSFEAVVKFIKKSKENYDVIIVLTDGYGGDINVKDIEPKKWFWGLTTNCNLSKTYGTIFKIPPEYIKW